MPDGPSSGGPPPAPPFTAGVRFLPGAGQSQEIALCVTADAPVIFVVQNDAGYMPIGGGQRRQTSRRIGTEFSHPDGSPYSPDFAAMGRSFGMESWKVSDAASLEPTLRKTVRSGAPRPDRGPHGPRRRRPPGSPAVGLPDPPYIKDERQDEYDRIRATEQHL
jgi:acetolactate synthase-1/2/3 large subunit